MVKQYASVSDLIRNVALDAETRATTEKRIAERSIIKQLMAQRAVKGLAQEDIAKRVNCSQGRISKLERSLDDDIRLGDLRAYARAVGCNFVCGIFPVNMKSTDAVKCHVFAIKKHMDKLAGLAQKDENIAKAVACFFGELFVNFARMFGDSVKKLPLSPNEEPYLNFHFDAMSDNNENIESQGSKSNCSNSVNDLMVVE